VSGNSATAPVRALKGFKRIALRAGESRMVNFELTPQQMSVVAENGMLVQPRGKLTISVGGGQPGIKLKTTSNSISKTITVS
jgi:beta-glucosidase